MSSDRLIAGRAGARSLASVLHPGIARSRARRRREFPLQLRAQRSDPFDERIVCARRARDDDVITA
jgi:hypothetical protein